MSNPNYIKHKFSRAGLVMVALLAPFARRSLAQIATQVTAGPSTMSSVPSKITSQNRSDAAAAMRSSGLMVVPEDFAQLTLAPGFLVSLNVLDDSDLVGTFRIDQHGDLSLPILGTIHVAGETVPEARVQIQKALLTNQILNDPQVNLTVLEYTAPQVTIIGEVASPGRYPLLVPRSLVDVLGFAGGATLTAGNQVQITRGSGSAEPILVDYSRATDPHAVNTVMVDPGDIVLVKQAGIVYVLGAVNRPGGYVMQEEGTLNVLQAISLANGTAIAANTSTIHLLRRNDQGVVADIPLSYKKLVRGQRADLQLHARDVVYVPTDKLKAIFSNGSSILAAASSASIYALAVH
jgi:polysaccharide export outer membrane protein